MYCIREAAQILGLDLSQATIAIQGYGNAGQFAHKLASELYGIAAHDPTTHLGAALLIVAVGVLATWLPARRATRVEPMTVLRTE